MVNFLSFLPSNPLSFSQYVRELHLAWKGCNDDAVFYYEMRTTTLVQNADVFCSIDISVTDHKLRTSSCPNGTPGHNWKTTKLDCWLQMPQRKLVMEAVTPRFDRCQKTVQTGTHQRIYWKKTVSQNSRDLLIMSDSHCFSALNVERTKKWLSSSSSTAIPKGMEIADNDSSVFLNHISCSWWRIVFHRSLDSTEHSLSWLRATWAWSSFLTFTLAFHQHAVHCGERRFWGLEVFCYLPLT